MHILHLYKDYAPVVGGIENHIRALAEAQARRGHTVTVLVTGPGPRTAESGLNGVRVIRAGRWATVASTPLSLDLFRVLGGLRPDITHLQSPYPVGEVAQWSAGRGRPYVVSYQADVTRAAQRLIMAFYGPLFRALLARAGRVLATTPDFARTSPWLRHVQDRIAVVPLGVDVGRFAPSTSPRPTAATATLLFVGRLRHYKGLDDLLRALPHVPGRPRLVVAGGGPMRAAWEALSASLGLGEQVRFLGDVPDDELPALYRSADVFVLPSTSRAESFGAVLVEAMASGLPCVTTEIGTGTSYVVQHAVTGLVVPPRSPEALAEALGRLLADPELRRRFGAAGRARAVQEFAVEAMVERVEQVYREVLALGPRAYHE